MEYEGDGDTNYGWNTWIDSKKLGKKHGGIGNQRKNWNQPGPRNSQDRQEYTEVSLKTEEAVHHSDHSDIPPANSGVKNFQG